MEIVYKTEISENYGLPTGFRQMSEWNQQVDWCLQKDKLVALIEALQTTDCHIILASNESSLITEELESEFFKQKSI